MLFTRALRNLYTIWLATWKEALHQIFWDNNIRLCFSFRLKRKFSFYNSLCRRDTQTTFSLSFHAKTVAEEEEGKSLYKNSKEKKQVPYT